ncbi:MAG: hypothetical protein QMD46_09020 [Methanomicrobiales archaeon]|nr:hypothetical protein [Methanomicrobiales archaeon]MDI6876657.1 hypothetical protein [Methanomicrobiales archaeon]
MAAERDGKAPRRSSVEIGTRECALYTLVNVDAARENLREVRRHVRGDHKRRIDSTIAVLNVIAFETQQMFAIADEEAEAFVRRHRAAYPR